MSSPKLAWHVAHCTNTMYVRARVGMCPPGRRARPGRLAPPTGNVHFGVKVYRLGQEMEVAEEAEAESPPGKRMRERISEAKARARPGKAGCT